MGSKFRIIKFLKALRHYNLILFLSRENKDLEKLRDSQDYTIYCRI